MISEALPEALAVAVQSGWPTPRSDVIWNGRTLSDVLIFGVTPGYQVVQDYRFSSIVLGIVKSAPFQMRRKPA